MKGGGTRLPHVRSGDIRLARPFPRMTFHEAMERTAPTAGPGFGMALRRSPIS